MSTTTLDPLEQARLDAMSVEELIAEARKRQRRGGKVAARRRYQKVLDRDPRHPEALVAIARATLPENLELADSLYRRALLVSDLEPEDYQRWAVALMSATPTRSRQAADVIRRLRDQFPDRPDVRAQAALRLAQLDDLASAEVVVRELLDVSGLDDDTSRRLVLIVEQLVNQRGPWTDRYSDPRLVLERLARSGGRATLFDAARVTWGQGYSASSLDYLNRFEEIESQAHEEDKSRFAESATLLRAYIEADSDLLKYVGDHL